MYKFEICGFKKILKPLVIDTKSYLETKKEFPYITDIIYLFLKNNVEILSELYKTKVKNFNDIYIKLSSKIYNKELLFLKEKNYQVKENFSQTLLEEDKNLFDYVLKYGVLYENKSTILNKKKIRSLLKNILKKINFEKEELKQKKKNIDNILNNYIVLSQELEKIKLNDTKITIENEIYSNGIKQIETTKKRILFFIEEIENYEIEHLYKTFEKLIRKINIPKEKLNDNEIDNLEILKEEVLENYPQNIEKCYEIINEKLTDNLKEKLENFFNKEFNTTKKILEFFNYLEIYDFRGLYELFGYKEQENDLQDLQENLNVIATKIIKNEKLEFNYHNDSQDYKELQEIIKKILKYKKLIENLKYEIEKYNNLLEKNNKFFEKLNEIILKYKNNSILQLKFEQNINIHNFNEIFPLLKKEFQNYKKTIKETIKTENKKIKEIEKKLENLEQKKEKLNSISLRNIRLNLINPKKYMVEDENVFVISDNFQIPLEEIEKFDEKIYKNIKKYNLQIIEELNKYNDIFFSFEISKKNIEILK